MAYIFDQESPAELARLINQDHLVTHAMEGSLSGLAIEEIAGLRTVLDLACGPGGWVLDVAFEHPTIEVAGVDTSKTMINYANARARSQQLTNASFGIMDITQPLDFSDASFDLVNARFLVAVLLREAWKPVLSEALRVLRPGGVLRLTECDTAGITSSAAHEYLCGRLFQAMQSAGYGFSVDGRSLGITPVLGSLMREVGFSHVQYQAHILDFSAQSHAWIGMRDNACVGFMQAKPLLMQAGMTQEEFKILFDQMVVERQKEDFAGLWSFATVIGVKQ